MGGHNVSPSWTTKVSVEIQLLEKFDNNFFYLVRLNTRHAEFSVLIVRIVSNQRQHAGTPAKLTQWVWIILGLVWYRKVLTRGKASSEQHKE